MSKMTDLLTGDQYDEIKERLEEALKDLEGSSGYLGSVGSGDYQKLAHALDGMDSDFDEGQVTAFLTGVLVALSLGDRHQAYYQAEVIAQDLVEYAGTVR